MVGEAQINPPSGGLNVSDSSIGIEENESTSIDNFMVNSLSLESIRPHVSFSAKVHKGLTNELVDSICVFKNIAGVTQYMFAFQGKVYFTDSQYGSIQDTGYSGNTSARINMVQFRNFVYIFNGVDENHVWNGNTIRTMGIEAPEVAPTLSNPTPAGTDVRYYFYTYYNSVDDIESNPSPYAVISNATPAQDGGTVVVSSTPPSDPQVDCIRFYRTGYGIINPKLIAGLTLDEASTPNTDDVLESYVVTQNALAFDHDKPPIVSNGIVHNNRLFMWGSPGDKKDTLWISNEFDAEYTPVVPFYETQVIKSGGPIELNPGDGGDIASFVPWGGSGIALKDTACYRIQEQEVGFYGYQTMSIPPCIAPHSVVTTQYGLIYLTNTGFVLIDKDEQSVNIGQKISNFTSNITQYDQVFATTFRKYYVVSFLIGNRWHGLMWNPENGWQGVSDTVVGSCYSADINQLLCGAIDDNFAYINICQIDKVGSVLQMNNHKPIAVKWVDKAREYYPGFYSRIRGVRVYGETIGRVGNQQMKLIVRDATDTVLNTTDFTFPASGSVVVGVDSLAMSRFLSLEISGQLEHPIRITSLRPMVEQIGYGFEE